MPVSTQSAKKTRNISNRQNKSLYDIVNAGNSMDKGKLYPSVSLKDQMDLIKTALNQNIANKSFANLAGSHKNLVTEESIKELKRSNQALEKAPRYIVNNIIRHEQK